MLTARQRQVYDFISDRIAATGAVPSCGDIAEHIGTLPANAAALVKQVRERMSPWPASTVRYFRFNDETKELEPWPPR